MIKAVNRLRMCVPCAYTFNNLIKNTIKSSKLVINESLNKIDRSTDKNKPELYSHDINFYISRNGFGLNTDSLFSILLTITFCYDIEKFEIYPPNFDKVLSQSVYFSQLEKLKLLYIKYQFDFMYFVFGKKKLEFLKRTKKIIPDNVVMKTVMGTYYRKNKSVEYQLTDAHTYKFEYNDLNNPKDSFCKDLIISKTFTHQVSESFQKNYNNRFKVYKGNNFRMGSFIIK